MSKVQEYYSYKKYSGRTESKLKNKLKYKKIVKNFHLVIFSLWQKGGCIGNLSHKVTLTN